MAYRCPLLILYRLDSDSSLMFSAGETSLKIKRSSIADAALPIN